VEQAMAEDEARDDTTLADTLGAFGARPLLDGTPEPDPASPEPTRWRTDEPPARPDQSRLGRLVGWVRWAAAPLGFFLFLAALTAYGVLRDRDGSTASDSAVDSQPAAAPVTTAAPTPTTPGTPMTALAPQITFTPSTGPPSPRSPTTLGGASTGRSAASAPAASGRQAAANDLPVTRLGPDCGHAPGETVPLTVDGRRQVFATAAADGCVSLAYYGPACGYTPGEMVDVVIDGRPEPPIPADAEGCVSVTL
jgi:hypothetical protein